MYITIMLIGTVYFVQSPSFDYETQQTYTLTLSVSDTINTAVTTTLTVNINDVNEQPEFNPTTYTATIAESIVSSVLY